MIFLILVVEYVSKFSSRNNHFYYPKPRFSIIPSKITRIETDAIVIDKVPFWKKFNSYLFESLRDTYTYGKKIENIIGTKGNITYRFFALKNVSDVIVGPAERKKCLISQFKVYFAKRGRVFNSSSLYTINTTVPSFRYSFADVFEADAVKLEFIRQSNEGTTCFPGAVFYIKL